MIVMSRRVKSFKNLLVQVLNKKVPFKCMQGIKSYLFNQNPAGR